MKPVRLLALAAAALAASTPPLALAQGDWATASANRSTLFLRLHYEMTCGLPGPGPLVVRLPSTARVSAALTALVDGVRRRVATRAHVLTVRLPKPPEVTCLSIAFGVLRVALRGVRVPAGVPRTVRARLPGHAFAARVSVRS